MHVVRCKQKEESFFLLLPYKRESDWMNIQPIKVPDRQIAVFPAKLLGALTDTRRSTVWISVTAVDYASLQKELLGYKPLGSKQSENVSAEKQKLILPLQLEPNISNKQSKVFVHKGEGQSDQRPICGKKSKNKFSFSR